MIYEINKKYVLSDPVNENEIIIRVIATSTNEILWRLESQSESPGVTNQVASNNDLLGENEEVVFVYIREQLD